MAKKKNLEWLNCSEEELFSVISEFVKAAGKPGSLILLAGEMGAGKSTFARALIRHLSKGARSQGSPTFPLVQEYPADSGFPIYHIDLYRLKSEAELNDSGIAEQIDAQDALVLIEWGSMFPDFFESYLGPRTRKQVFRVSITGTEGLRNYRAEQF